VEIRSQWDIERRVYFRYVDWYKRKADADSEPVAAEAPSGIAAAETAESSTSGSQEHESKKPKEEEEG